MQFKSIASRIILSVMPIIVISTVVFVLVCYRMSYSSINQSINEKMMESLRVANLSIQSELDKNAAITESFYSFAVTCNKNTFEEHAFEDYLSTVIPSNKNTVGGGIWYEPYRYKGREYFGPYAYMSEGIPVFAAEYESIVDYHLTDWYADGKNSNGEIVWSSVYLDPVPNVTMVTSTKPFYDDDGKFMGVTTADIDLVDIRRIVSQIAVGDTGWAFLLGENGEFIYFDDAGKTLDMKMQNDGDVELAKLGETLMSLDSGTTSFVREGLPQRVFFEKMSDVGWCLAIAIDEREIGQSTLNQMLLMAMIPIVGLVLAAWSLIAVARYMRRITTKVNKFAMSATDGEITNQIDVTEYDEFGIMENQLNIMVSNMEAMRKQSEERLELAQAASLAKSEFLSRMSHEIRTPMNAIIGMTQIAKSTSEFSKSQECLDRISSASKLLLSLINDILDMSKIEANKLEIQHEQFAFDDIVKNIETVIDVKVKEKKQTLLVSVSDNVPQRLIGDELRLVQVVNNLLSNAIKFTPEKGRITVNFDVIDANDDDLFIEVRVKDSGIGISDEQKKRLFDSFEQADGSVARKFGGTGLGLSISKNIVELMGGAIDVVSELGKGSEFIFTVKMKRAQEHDDTEAAETENEDYDFSGYHLLLTEDIEINREIVMAILESTNIQIDCAENGLEACEIMRKSPEKYNAIFMDLQMPEMGGIEAAHTIRNMDNEHCRTIPIIAMTANAFKEDADKCLEVGMNDHIAKPIDGNVVLKKLAEYLGV